jgi:hypothetical protein
MKIAAFNLRGGWCVGCGSGGLSRRGSGRLSRSGSGRLSRSGSWCPGSGSCHGRRGGRSFRANLHSRWETLSIYESVDSRRCERSAGHCCGVHRLGTVMLH